MDKTKRKGEEIPPFLNSNIHVWKNKSGDLTIINLRNIDEILQPPVAAADVNVVETAPKSPVTDKVEAPSKLAALPDRSVLDKLGVTTAVDDNSQKPRNLESKKAAGKTLKSQGNVLSFSKQNVEKPNLHSDVTPHAPCPTENDSSAAATSTSRNGNTTTSTATTGNAAVMTPVLANFSKHKNSEYKSSNNSVARNVDSVNNQNAGQSSGAAIGSHSSSGNAGNTTMFDLTNNTKFELMPGTSIGGNVVSEHASAEGAMQSLALFHNPLWGDGAAISVEGTNAQQPKPSFSNFTVESGTKPTNTVLPSASSPSRMTHPAANVANPHVSGSNSSQGTTTPHAVAGQAGMQFASAPFGTTPMNFPMFQMPVSYVQQPTYAPSVIGYPGGMQGYYIPMAPQGAVSHVAIGHPFPSAPMSVSLPVRTGTNVEASPFVPIPPRSS